MSLEFHGNGNTQNSERAYAINMETWQSRCHVCASGLVHLHAVNSSIMQDTLQFFSQQSSTLGQ